MKTLQELIAKMSALVQEQKTLFAKEDATDDDLTRMEAITTELMGLDAKKAQLQRIEEAKAANAVREAELNTLGARPTVDNSKAADPGASSVPVQVISRARLKNFKGENAPERAFKMGQFFLATIGRKKEAQDWCKANGISLKVHTESNDSQGGFLVPTELDDELIVLREQFGIFRQFAKRKGMKSDSRLIPRRKGGLTAYFTTESQTITESTKGWDNVELVAKKLAVLAKYSNELSEDSIVDIGDDLAGEIAYAFAKKEDDAGFNGTGAAAYGGIIGVTSRFLQVDPSIANIKGLTVGSGNGYGTAWNFLLSDFDAVKGNLPQYADTPDAGWFCHKTFYNNVMERLMLAAGGVTAAEIAAGRRVPQFMGYPVHFSQIMPSASAVNQIPVFFGDLSLAAAFGDRRQTTIAMSEHLNFAEDEIAIRGTERFDINVHDVGDTNGPGPIVGLVTASS